MGCELEPGYPRVLPRGLEPRTLRLLAVRSDQLSYKSFEIIMADWGIVSIAGGSRSHKDQDPRARRFFRSKIAKPTARGFEPPRAEPIGFRVRLLNHSDTLPHDAAPAFLAEIHPHDGIRHGC